MIQDRPSERIRGERLAALPREGSAVEPAAVENPAAAGPFVIVCDHAANAVPPEYAALGLGPGELAAHIAWDPGALGVSRRLAQALDAPLVHATVSRLVIDCNRALDAPDLIAVTSETTAIPGNAALSDAERRRRIACVHAPYHAALEQFMDERLDAGRATALVAVHSFTPVYRGVSRPWEIGVLFDRDRRLAEPLIEAFRAEGLAVGINAPYSPADGVYYTMRRHGEARGLPCVMLEIRNDLIRDEAGEAAWAARLARVLAPLGVSTEAA
jgi:predicted N-formylglutamate amidohydrolase